MDEDDIAAMTSVRTRESFAPARGPGAASTPAAAAAATSASASAPAPSDEHAFLHRALGSAPASIGTAGPVPAAGMLHSMCGVGGVGGASVAAGVGRRLLQGMGWREGQAVGPRVRRRRRRRSVQACSGSGSGSGSGSDSGSDDWVPEGVALAPRLEDMEQALAAALPPLVPKLDEYGLGYQPFEGAPEFALAARRRRIGADGSRGGLGATSGAGAGISRRLLLDG